LLSGKLQIPEKAKTKIKIEKETIMKKAHIPGKNEQRKAKDPVCHITRAKTKVIQIFASKSLCDNNGNFSGNCEKSQVAQKIISAIENNNPSLVRKSLKGSPFSADTQHNINKIADDLVA
jgi:hypothetical protein